MRLYLIDMVAYQRQSLGIEGGGQQVIQVHIIVNGKGQVFRERIGLVACDQSCQPVQMPAIERSFAADRQPDAVNRQRVALADFAQVNNLSPAFRAVDLGGDGFETPPTGLVGRFDSFF